MDTQEKPTEKAFYLQCAECTQKHLANAIAYAADAIPCINPPFEGYQRIGLLEKSVDYWLALLMLCRAYINLVETMTGYGDHFVFAVGLLGRAQSHMYAANVSGVYAESVRDLRRGLEAKGPKGVTSQMLIHLDDLALELSCLSLLPEMLAYRFMKAYADFAEALREAPIDIAMDLRMLDAEDGPRDIADTLDIFDRSGEDCEGATRDLFRSKAVGLIECATSLYGKVDRLRSSFEAVKPAEPAEPEALQEGGDNHDDQD